MLKGKFKNILENYESVINNDEFSDDHYFVKEIRDEIPNLIKSLIPEVELEIEGRVGIDDWFNYPSISIYNKDFAVLYAFLNTRIAVIFLNDNSRIYYSLGDIPDDEDLISYLKESLKICE